MPESVECNASCLCGAVGVTVKHMSLSVGGCHCGMCRKWSGGPLLAVDCGADVNWQGEDRIAVFDSSDWAQRGFCSQCGTHLFYRIKSTNQHIIPVGLFDRDARLVFDHQVFVDEKPDYYAFSNETKNMTGAEVFAQYAPSAD